MKKKFYLTIAALAVVAGGVLAFLSCDSEKERFGMRGESSKLDDFIYAAELHSIALERYFQEVMVNDVQFTRALSDGSVTQNLGSEVERIVGDLVVNDSRLEKLVNKYEIREAVATRSLEQLPDNFASFIEESFIAFYGIFEMDLLKTKINQQLEKEEYKQFSKEEQDHILFVFAIYADSATYWDENIDKWLDVIDPTATLQTRWPMSPSERDMYRSAAGSKAGQADAKGAIKGGVMGAAGGVGLSFLGGWGCVAGLVVGWVSGAIDASVSTILEADFVDAVDPRIPEPTTPVIPTTPIF